MQTETAIEQARRAYETALYGMASWDAVEAARAELDAAEQAAETPAKTARRLTARAEGLLRDADKADAEGREHAASATHRLARNPTDLMVESKMRQANACFAAAASFRAQAVALGDEVRALLQGRAA